MRQALRSADVIKKGISYMVDMAFGLYLLVQKAGGVGLALLCFSSQTGKLFLVTREIHSVNFTSSRVSSEAGSSDPL